MQNPAAANVSRKSLAASNMSKGSLGRHCPQSDRVRLKPPWKHAETEPKTGAKKTKPFEDEEFFTNHWSRFSPSRWMEWFLVGDWTSQLDDFPRNIGNFIIPN